MVSTDGDHGTGWFDVQRLPEELWAGAPPKRMPLRRLAEVYTEQEAVPLLKQELLKARDAAVAVRTSAIPRCRLFVPSHAVCVSKTTALRPHSWLTRS